MGDLIDGKPIVVQWVLAIGLPLTIILGMYCSFAEPKWSWMVAFDKWMKKWGALAGLLMTAVGLLMVKFR